MAAMQQPTIQPILLKTTSVMKLLSCGRTTIMQWIAEGKLKVVSVHKRNMMFLVSDILTMLENAKKK